MKNSSVSIPSASRLLVPALLLVSAARANTVQDLLPLAKGYVAATCFSNTSSVQYNQDPNGYVVAIVDGSAAEIAAAPFDIAGGSHAWRTFHNELAVQNPGAPTAAREWKAANLGEVFGVTLDDTSPPNIYVAGTSAYGMFPSPLGNSRSTVYKLNGTDGSITAWNSIPVGAAGLGNLCFHRASSGTGFLYVSNLDDGLIYRLDVSSGLAVGAPFDHGVSARPVQSLPAIADSAAVFTPHGRRVWGVQVNQGRLFYGVWYALGSQQQEIWSVALDATGNFQPATALIEIKVAPFFSGGTFSLPVSDIAFAPAGGRILFAERYHSGVGEGGTHQGRVLEYTGSSGSWTAAPVDKFRVGDYSTGDNSAGGVAVECAGAVWASGDALNYPSPFIYGITRMPAGGNEFDVPYGANSHFVDLDGIITNVPKTMQGDVETFDPCETKCLEVSEIKVECPKEPGGAFTATFTIKNTGTQTADYIWYTPCPAADLPAGAVTVQPLPAGVNSLSPPLAPGASTTQTIQFPGVNGGAKVCFRITLLDKAGEECCTEKVCFDMPECDCFLVEKKTVECKQQADGTFQICLTITLKNLSNFTWYQVNFLPPALFTPSSFDLSATPVPPGGTVTLTTCINSQPGLEVCFFISVHDKDIDVCCSQECCIVLPDCDVEHPDLCEVTRVAPCCPPAPGTADITLTICNNGAVPRTYDWDISSPAPVPPCTKQIPDALFAPSSGSVSVPAGGCVSLVIKASCEGFKQGDCANFIVCVQERNNPQNRFCCDGIVQRPQPGQPVVKDPAGGLAPHPLNPGEVGNLRFEVINTESAAMDVPFVIWSNPLVLRFQIEGQPEPPSNFAYGFVRLPAGATQLVNLRVFPDPGLLGDGTIIPLFFSHVSPERVPGPTLGSSSIRMAPGTVPGFQIEAFQLRPDGRLVLDVQTRTGHVYRVQKSQDFINALGWQGAQCSPENGGPPADEFNGNGEVVRCVIEPEPLEPRMFFRVVEFASP
ncbi:MAG: hypothetical protein ACR2OZ_00390 [Verrucomicrobiales bacterium]